MTLRLILTRHAKSDWDDPSLDDHDRPLNKRGRRAAGDIGRWLSAKGLVPDQVLCSTAARTRETWTRIEAQLGSGAKPTLYRELYLASPQEMLDCLRRNGNGSTVMMLAHNPGTGMFAAMLAQEPPADPTFARYPTAYTTVLEFEAAGWADVDWGAGTVIEAVAPRTLERTG